MWVAKNEIFVLAFFVLTHASIAGFSIVLAYGVIPPTKTFVNFNLSRTLLAQLS